MIVICVYNNTRHIHMWLCDCNCSLLATVACVRNIWSPLQRSLAWALCSRSRVRRVGLRQCGIWACFDLEHAAMDWFLAWLVSSQETRELHRDLEERSKTQALSLFEHVRAPSRKADGWWVRRVRSIVAELISKNTFWRPKSPMKKLQSCKRHILIILGFILGFILQQTGISFQCFVLQGHAIIACSGPCRMWDVCKESTKSMAEVSRLSALLEAPGLVIQPLSNPRSQYIDRLVRKLMSFVGSTWLWYRS